MGKFFKSIEFRLCITAVFAGFVIISLFYRVYPESAIRIPVSKQEIQRRAEVFMDSLGYDVTKYKHHVHFVHDAELLRYLQQTYGSTHSIALISDSLPVYSWECYWETKTATRDSNQITVSIGDDNRKEKSEFQLNFSLKGKPIGLKIQTKIDSFPEYNSQNAVVTAKTVFNRIITDSSEWTFTDVSELPNSGNNQSYRIRWQRRTPLAGIDTRFFVDITDGHVVTFQTEMMVPAIAAGRKSLENVLEIVSFLLVYMFFVILGLIFLIKRLRSDLVDLLSGLVPGILVAVGWSVLYWHEMANENFGIFLLGFVIIVPFITGAIWGMFVLGESFAREVWTEKLQLFDQLRKRVISSQFGLAIIHGILLGTVYLSIHLVLSYIHINWLHEYLPLGNKRLIIWSTSVPAILVIGQAMMSALVLVIPVCLFYISMLKRYIKNSILIFVLSGITWSMICSPIHECAWTIYRLPLNLILGLFLIFVFVRFELFTALFTIVSSIFMYRILLFISCDNSLINRQAILLAGLLVLSLFYGLWLSFHKKKFPDSPKFIPDYMKRTFHREQLQRELEIARHVQLYFLPQKNPQYTELDIASFCYPAREVGGDYFDFIRLGEKKLGVVIGDVSGKGIPAAFYMTLTKGLFKSQAALQTSPKEVLIQVNQLFFENARRGVFISMLYCIFDVETMQMTFARAGHNPMFLHRFQESIPEEICPPGIAIGLDQSMVFRQSIQERTLSLQAGDVFLLYTDGLNEAQNPMNEEFGEERIRDMLKKHEGQNVQRILQSLAKCVQDFSSGAEQHDDMTAVIIKIK